MADKNKLTCDHWVEKGHKEEMSGNLKVHRLKEVFE